MGQAKLGETMAKKRSCSRYLSLLSLLCLLSPLSPLTAQTYDVIIRNGRVLDGSGSPWRYTDIAIDGDRIVAVGALRDASARRVLDATGLFVAPGFIDPHSHASSGLIREQTSSARPLLTQGITTVFINPDGGGPIDLDRQRGALMQYAMGVNAAQLVPHGSVRRVVLGMEDRAPTPSELDSMRAIVRRGMEAGAFGLSSGLYYAPGSYAQTGEVVELARVAAEYGGVYTSHIRDEADYNIGLIGAVDEVITVARDGGLPGVVTHVKALGPRVWGYSQAIVERIDRARAQGIEVYADQYPYDASGTSITGALVPRWAQVGGGDSLQARISDADARARLRADMLVNLDRRGGADKILFRDSPRGEDDIVGRTLDDMARDRAMEPVDVAIEILARGGAGVISFNMIERDIETLMRQPWTMTSTDGSLPAPGEGFHPRGIGTYPRKIRRYVVERGTVSLSRAIHSMTGLPASVFRMDERGAIRIGAVADIVVFNLERVTDRATYIEPYQLSEGMIYVMVNGELAIDGGEPTGVNAGMVLARSR